MAETTRLIFGWNARRPNKLGNFDRVLKELNVVITPEAVLARKARVHTISAFNSRSNAEEVARGLEKFGV